MKRRKAREEAVAFLYQAEIRNELEKFSEEGLSSFLEHQKIKDKEVEEFIYKLVKGTIQNLSFIDKKISEHSINWSLKRMPYIDRNILRIAVYEMLFLDDVPEVVAINEAIELAKRYSGRESPKFINGVLHTIKEEHIKNKTLSKDENQ